MIDGTTALTIVLNGEKLHFGKVQNVNFLNPGAGTLTVELPNHDEPYNREHIAKLIVACGKDNVTVSLSGSTGTTEYTMKLSSVTFNAIPLWETLVIKAQYQ